jgi:hypothetical protein
LKTSGGMFDKQIFNLDGNEEIDFGFIDNFLISEDFVMSQLIRV